MGSTYVKLLGGLAQGGVVLLNEVPANLVVGELATVRVGLGRSVNAGWGSRVSLEGTLVLLLLTKAAVGGHDCGRFGRGRDGIVDGDGDDSRDGRGTKNSARTWREEEAVVARADSEAPKDGARTEPGFEDG